MGHTNGVHTNGLPTDVAVAAPDDSAPVAIDGLGALAARAEALRTAHKYTGKLTQKVLNALAPLLVQPAPSTVGSESDRDRGFALLVFQRHVMDTVLLPSHWRDLTHFDDGGRTADAWIVIGDCLGSVKLNLGTGELEPGPDARITKTYNAPGGRERADSKGDLLKASRTSALSRLLAEIGPGFDAFTAPFRAPGPGEPRLRNQYMPDGTAMAGVGEVKADEVEVKLLLKIIRDRGLPASQVARLIREAAGAAPVSYPTEQAAQLFIAERLDDRRIVLARGVFPVLKRLLEGATAESPLPARPDLDAGADGAGDGRGTEVSTVPFDPGAPRTA